MYYIEILFKNSVSHASVAFNTTDKGLVFFEPQTDELVILEINKEYWYECINSSKYDQDPDSIVVDYKLFW